MRYKVFVLAFILMLCLVACGTEDENVTGYVEDDPLSEKEICIYVQNYMKDTYGDDTEVKVTGKYELTHRTYTSPGLDGAPGLFGNKFATIKNGHTSALIEGREHLVSLVRPGGILILAGILTTEYPAVRDAFAALGCVELGNSTEREWTGGSFRTPAS